MCFIILINIGCPSFGWRETSTYRIGEVNKWAKMMVCQNNRKAYLWSLLVPLIIPLVVVITVLSSSGMALADDHDVELQDVMDGNVPGLTATVNGSGGGYYGDSLRVSFSNDTTQALRIKIPIGLRLAPEDTSVQTMITAGTEIIT